MRRPVGLGGLQAAKKRDEKFKEKGANVEGLRMAQMQERLKFFRESLEDFAQKHKKDINKDPEFRHRFSQMCMKIGVDPLASSKGFWAELLGVGDFFYELAVQIIEICIRTRDQNGGLMELNEVVERVNRRRNKFRGGQQGITANDVKQSIRNIKILGNGFELLLVGGRYYVQSVPCELSGDHTEILGVAAQKNGLTLDQYARELSWTYQRVDQAMNLLLQEGFAWVDEQTRGERTYWFPGLIDQQQLENK
ncbi:vacuolar protein sorting protein VPS22 [Acrasis kona]|uniref:Vacuolar protein sorting protein VPS22 n=1 Tax=Acrasis kona TaxID=1008807 RepID=A0AAW2YK17_9EUKA